MNPRVTVLTVHACCGHIYRGVIQREPRPTGAAVALFLEDECTTCLAV